MIRNLIKRWKQYLLGDEWENYKLTLKGKEAHDVDSILAFRRILTDHLKAAEEKAKEGKPMSEISSEDIETIIKCGNRLEYLVGIKEFKDKIETITKLGYKNTYASHIKTAEKYVNEGRIRNAYLELQFARETADENNIDYKIDDEYKRVEQLYKST